MSAKKIKLKDYVKRLNKLAEENPDAILIYSSDDEGNNYNEVHFEPEIIYYSKKEKEINDIPYDGYVKAICVN
jgi:hypothetical protein